jgi:hypothetical protein
VLKTLNCNILHIYLINIECDLIIGSDDGGGVEDISPHDALLSRGGT